MGDRTGIAWTDHTWNPWQGCHPVSAGCDHCYMYREKRRYGQDPAVVVRSKPGTFRAPLRWKEPARVFVCSWSDFFLEEADAWRAEAWEIMRATPHLTYQVLTKRPERMAGCLPDDWGAGWRNVWLGVTAENQEMTDRRIPVLLETPAAVRFVSVEPMLGPVDLDRYLWRYSEYGGRIRGELGLLQWVIVGGESGPNARQMYPQWVRDVRDQCIGAGVAFFFKQWSPTDPYGHHLQGCLLDGREWREVPDGPESP